MKNIEKEILFKKRFLTFVKVFSAVISVCIIFYALGFRIQPNLRVSKNAQFVLDIKEEGSVVEINNFKIKTDKENSQIKVSASIKLNKIRVSKDGFFVWEKNIYPKPNERVYLEPVFKKINSSGVFIRENDPDYYNIYYKTINNSPLPTALNPKTLDGVKVWAEKNTIMVNNGYGDFGIFESSGDIRSLDFYKDNKNYIIYSADNSIYILEINQDDDGFQNTFPVYTGTSPVFAHKDSKNIYIVDGKNLLELEI